MPEAQANTGRTSPMDAKTDWSTLRGKFIVLDGGEGCGKSTQARKLLHFLHGGHGLPVTFLRDPGSTTIGEQIRHVLLDPSNGGMAMRCEMLCYMAARAQMVVELISPALERNDIVVCDRFISSTLAYQLGGDSLTRDEIMNVGEVATGGRWPDLTIVLDMSVEASQLRVKPKFVPLFQGDVVPDPSKDRIEQRPIAYHRQVRENYIDQAKAWPERYALVNADRDADVVFTDLVDALRRVAQAG